MTIAATRKYVYTITRVFYASLLKTSQIYKAGAKSLIKFAVLAFISYLLLPSAIVLASDTDNDGLPDDWENQNFGNLNQGPKDDPDRDGLGNWEEYRIGSLPNNSDTDGDGVLDGSDPFPTDPKDADGPTFAVEVKDVGFKMCNNLTRNPKNQAIRVLAVTDTVCRPYLDAEIENLGGGKWELRITNVKPNVTITEVNFPWELHKFLLNPNSADDIVYYPYLLGVTKWAKAVGNWSWQGLKYPGGSFAPVMVIGDQTDAKLMAAINWPPKRVTPFWSLGRMIMTYATMIPTGGSDKFGVLINRVHGDARTGNYPWQLALDPYKTWFGQSMAAWLAGYGKSYPLQYPEWMEKSHGWINIQLQNGRDYDLILADIRDKWNRWKKKFPWIQLWGQMSDYTGGCCDVNRNMNPRYQPGLPKLVSEIASDPMFEGHISYYSRPLVEEKHTCPHGESSCAGRIYQLDDNRRYDDWDATQETPLEYFRTGLMKNKEIYHANAFYIDTFSGYDWGDPFFVANLFLNGVIPEGVVTEFLIDINPAAFLISGVLKGGNLNGGPGKTPENTETTTFANFGRYLLSAQPMLLGESNDNAFWDASSNFWGERQAFLLGAKLDVIHPDEIADIIGEIVEARDGVNFWSRKPAYLANKQISEIVPAFVEMSRFTDKDGIDLFAIVNWTRENQVSFKFKGEQKNISIPIDPVTNLPRRFYVYVNEHTPMNQPPVANAGPNLVVTDKNNDGQELIHLDGKRSYDPDGTIVSYQWTKNGNQFATGATPTVTLATGTRTIITLTVTDNGSSKNSTTISVTVYPSR